MGFPPLNHKTIQGWVGGAGEIHGIPGPRIRTWATQIHGLSDVGHPPVDGRGFPPLNHKTIQGWGTQIHG